MSEKLPQGWQCPYCKTVHSPDAIMCWCYGNTPIVRRLKPNEPWKPIDRLPRKHNTPVRGGRNYGEQ